MKNKKSIRLVFFVFLLISSIGVCTSIIDQSDQYKIARYLNNNASTGYAFALGGKVCSVFLQLISYNEQSQLYKVEVDSEIYNFTSIMDKELRLKDSKWVTKEKDLIKLLGHDKRITIYDLQSEKATIQYYMKGKLEKTKVVDYNQDILDSDIIYLYLQKMLVTGTTKFNCDVLLKARGLKMNVNFNRETVKDLTTFSPEYNFPRKFREFADQLAGSDKRFFVYVMQLTGIYKLFYPHKYYTAFTESSPHQLVAYWGGAPKEADFMFIESIEGY